MLFYVKAVLSTKLEDLLKYVKSCDNTHKNICMQCSSLELTTTPRQVLAENRYKKFPRTPNVFPLSFETSIFCTALKRTTDVASFTTPSPKTMLYSKGVSSWWRTYNRLQIHCWPCVYNYMNSPLGTIIIKKPNRSQ